MSNRILDFADEPARLSMRMDQLIVQRLGKEDVSIPLADVAVLLVSHQQVCLTHAVLSTLAAKGGALVVGNERHLPVAMCLPLTGNSTQAETFVAQAEAGLPAKKRIWQAIVQSKVRAQAHLLQLLHDDDDGLFTLAKQVGSGDPDNVEGRAAQRYWPALFKNRSFRRDQDAPDQNRFLNYGYAVVRAIVARAICSAGLHPTLGVHHHNRYDSYCLADDLMEPFRPLVDYCVVRLLEHHDPEAVLNKEIKTCILRFLLGHFVDAQSREERTLFDWSTRLSASVANVFLGRSSAPAVPDLVINMSG